MIIKFWGAARTVTGSMHLLQLMDGRKILLDCGLYQGGGEAAEELNKHWPIEPSEIDILVLSHAHIDHCGNIPHLVKDGFDGKIFCTHATFDLATIMLQDSAKIQEMDAMHDNRWRVRKGLKPIEPLYTVKDVAPALNNFYTLPYNKWTTLDEGVELLFQDAGHMLGSATVSLKINEGGRIIRLGFTGDIGRKGAMLLKDPVPMPACDFLISESTYGGHVHESIPDSEERLMRIIHETCVQKRGKLVIPAFSVGRTQNLVYTMNRLYNAGRLPRIPVYVDSPLSFNATQVFQMHPECFDEETNDYMRTDPDPFGFNGLHYIRDAEDSKELNASNEPMVIVSASGMITAGRILHHVAHTIEDSRNTILIVGYCAKGTIGEKLVNGAEAITVHGESHVVRAKIEKLNAYSGHADQPELYQYIRKSQDPDKIKSIFLVHGEEERIEAFQEYLTGNGYKDVHIPRRGEMIEI